jgi:hypothetical protein
MAQAQFPPLSFYKRSKLRNLSDGNHHVTSDATDEYNCAAHAVEDTTRRWWPDPDHRRYYWPVPLRDDSLDAFIQGFAAVGFVECPPDDSNVVIVVYGDDLIRPDEPLHVVRRLPNGHWTSKLGPWEDIEHDTLNDVSSPGYGEPRLFFRRRDAST